MVDAGKRAEIQAELHKTADEILAAADSMPIYEEEDWYKVQLEWQNECPVIVNKLSIDGVFVADYEAYCKDWLNNIKKIAPANASYEAMEEDGGHACVFQTITPGVPLVSNRSLCSTYYHKKDGDDYTFMISSKGNEHLIAKKEAEIGNNVVANIDVNSMHFTPMKDSCDDICGTEIT